MAQCIPLLADLLTIHLIINIMTKLLTDLQINGNDLVGTDKKIIKKGYYKKNIGERVIKSQPHCG